MFHLQLILPNSWFLKLRFILFGYASLQYFPLDIVENVCSFPYQCIFSLVVREIQFSSIIVNSIEIHVLYLITTQGNSS